MAKAEGMYRTKEAKKTKTTAETKRAVFLECSLHLQARHRSEKTKIKPVLLLVELGRKAVRLQGLHIHPSTQTSFQNPRVFTHELPGFWLQRNSETHVSDVSQKSFTYRTCSWHNLPVFGDVKYPGPYCAVRRSDVFG